MRLVYALQFQIATPAGVTGVSVPDMLRADVGAWIRDWYKKRQEINFELPGTSRLLAPLPLHSVETSYRSTSSGTVHQAVTWGYPAEPDNRLLWESRCEWAATDEDIEFSFLLRLASREFLVAPPQFDIRRPRIVRSIIQKYNCTSGGVSLHLLPQQVWIKDIPSLVETLYSKRRRLPVVLFSVDPYSDKPVADPIDSQDKLVGLAHVAVLADKWASFALTNALGKSLSCFNGAIRIYWPGFDAACDPRDHPVLLPGRIRGILADGKLLSDYLLRWFAPASTLRFAYGQITRDALVALEAEHRAEIDALRKKAEAGGDYPELLRIADDEIADLKKVNEALNHRVTDVESKLATAKANISALSLVQAGEVPASELQVLSEPELENVRAAVDLAAKRFPDTLIFLKSALTSADDSPYGQPDKVFQALEALDDVCKVWRESIQRKQSMGPLEEAFASRGFIYKAKESMTSTGKWGEEYTTLYEGVKVAIEPHLALGKGGPDTCLRIHFFRGEEQGRFIVSHVGRHKTNVKT
jgi:hypothetical protein